MGILTDSLFSGFIGILYIISSFLGIIIGAGLLILICMSLLLCIDKIFNTNLVDKVLSIFEGD